LKEVKMRRWDQKSIDMLTEIYQSYDLPSDTIIKNPQNLENFTKLFNQKNGGPSFSEEEVADQILKLRKTGKLPRLRR
jgi:hypothetical protein